MPTLVKRFGNSLQLALATLAVVVLFSTALAVFNPTQQAEQAKKSIKISVQKEEVFDFNSATSLEAISCLSTLITLKVDDVPIQDIAKNLSQTLEKNLVITLPDDPDQAKPVSTLSIDITHVPLKDMLRFLTDQGCQVKIDDVTFSSTLKPLSTTNYLVTISTVDTTVQDVVNILNNVCRKNITIASGDSTSKVSLSAKKASLEQVLEIMSKQTNCQFASNSETKTNTK